MISHTHSKPFFPDKSMDIKNDSEEAHIHVAAEEKTSQRGGGISIK
jgi:hypothetical protein